MAHLLETPAKGSRTPSAFDRALGVRIRLLRNDLGISQAELGRAVGVTFQQIQKYERGDDRLSGSRLCKMCEALQVTPNELLAYQETSHQTKHWAALQPLLTSPEGRQLATLFSRLPDRKVRRQIVKAIACFLEGPAMRRKAQPKPR